MSGKYIKYKNNKDSHELVMLFENELGHDEVLRMIQRTHPDIVAISAGFWMIGVDGTLIPFGKSVSLGLDSDEKDTMFLNYRFDTNANISNAYVKPIKSIEDEKPVKPVVTPNRPVSNKETEPELSSVVVVSDESYPVSKIIIGVVSVLCLMVLYH